MSDAPYGDAMSTTKPRITVTLPVHHYAVLSSLSDLQGVSMSSVMVDLFDTVLPVLERAVDILKSARDAPQSVKDSIKKLSEDAEARVSPAALDIISTLDQMAGLSSDKQGTRSAPSVRNCELPAPEGARPHPTNRGVRFTPQPSKTTMKKGSVLKKKKGVVSL